MWSCHVPTPQIEASHPHSPLYHGLLNGLVQSGDHACDDGFMLDPALTAEVTAEIPDTSVVYACSGSIRRLCRLQGKAHTTLTTDDLMATVTRLEEAAWRYERLALKGMDPARVDVLLPAALIHQALARRFAWSSYQLSSGGLRRGLLDAQLGD